MGLGLMGFTGFKAQGPGSRVCVFISGLKQGLYRVLCDFCVMGFCRKL